MGQQRGVVRGNAGWERREEGGVELAESDKSVTAGRAMFTAVGLSLG
jgi:hypothetical protein